MSKITYEEYKTYINNLNQIEDTNYRQYFPEICAGKPVIMLPPVLPSMIERFVTDHLSSESKALVVISSHHGIVSKDERLRYYDDIESIRSMKIPLYNHQDNQQGRDVGYRICPNNEEEFYQIVSILTQLPPHK